MTFYFRSSRNRNLNRFWKDPQESPSRLNLDLKTIFLWKKTRHEPLNCNDLKMNSQVSEKELKSRSGKRTR